MKKMTRAIALFLAAALLCALLPIGVLPTAALTEGDYTYEVVGDGVRITGYSGSGGNIVVPMTLGGKPVRYIGGFAFNSNTITGITILGNVQVIEDSAFFGCPSLSTIQLPSSLTKIGRAVFFETAYSENPNNWKDGVLYVGNWAVEANYDIASCTLQNGTVGIADETFYLKESLATVTLPNSLKYIGASAFKSCKALHSIVIPDSVTTIGWEAFAYCEALESVTLPAGLTAIDASTFMDCEALAEVTIPDSVTSIGFSAFENCAALEGIDIPDSVTSIGENAFTGTADYFDNANWENDVLYLDDWLILAKTTMSSCAVKEGTKGIADAAFANHTTLHTVTLADTTAHIGLNAFNGCTALANVQFGRGLQTIGAWAFRQCTSLSSLTLKSGVKAIGREAFYDCKALKTVFIPESVAAIDDNAFGYVNDANRPTAIADFTVQGIAATAAETYARENGFTFSAHNHEYGDEWVSDTSGHRHVCSCGADDSTEPHTFEWVIDQKPTPAVPGVKHEECSVCHYKQNENTPEEFTALLGDLDQNGKVNTTDARLVLQLSAGVIDETAIDQAAADVDQSGKINTTDARLILQLAAGVITQFPTAA